MEREQNLEEKPSFAIEMSTQPVSMFIRRKRRWWLLIVGGIAACLPVGILLTGIHASQGSQDFVFSSALAFSYAQMAAGPVLSAVLWWHLIVNRAPRPTWKRGLVAALLAEFCAYPLTAIALVMLKFLPAIMTQPGPAILQVFPMMLFLSVASFIVFPMFGLYTTICAVILGPLLGAIQGYREIHR